MIVFVQHKIVRFIRMSMMIGRLTWGLTKGCNKSNSYSDKNENDQTTDYDETWKTMNIFSRPKYGLVIIWRLLDTCESPSSSEECEWMHLLFTKWDRFIQLWNTMDTEIICKRVNKKRTVVIRSHNCWVERWISQIFSMIRYCQLEKEGDRILAAVITLHLFFFKTVFECSTTLKNENHEYELHWGWGEVVWRRVHYLDLLWWEHPECSLSLSLNNLLILTTS